MVSVGVTRRLVLVGATAVVVAGTFFLSFLMDRSLLPEGNVCVQGGRGQPQSCLPAQGPWRGAGPGEMADRSQSPSSAEQMICCPL